MSSSMGRIIYPIYEMENKIHVPNHQPGENHGGDPGYDKLVAGFQVEFIINDT